MNSPSAIAPVANVVVPEVKEDESARFERARRDARTICAGLFDGQRLERMAGKAEADCRKGRKAGPPDRNG